MSADEDASGNATEKMRHDQLVNTIRGVHEHLRRSCQMGTHPDEVWSEHVKEKSIRESYAQAMKELATVFWTSAENSRINWCCSVWRWYYKENGITYWVNKFLQRYPDIHFSSEFVSELQTMKKIKVLDVGSCYNPFKSFEECECLALDLTPASMCVYECDFLSLRILEAGAQPSKRENGSKVCELPKESFHVVVFSLLLEYLPSSFQRWQCCVLACQLLVPLGLLLIITPDSKSQHKNAPMMKSWREAIEELGMHRILYKKLPHLHCMAFCKLHYDKTCPDENALVSARKMYIPQDTNDYMPVNPPFCEERTEQSDNELKEQFLVLPFFEYSESEQTNKNS